MARAARLLPRDVVALTRLFPVLWRVEAVADAPRKDVEIPDSRELRRRASAALREVVARLTDQTPVLLCIDDAQWGDADSASVLSKLLRPPEAPPILLILSYRSESREASPFLGPLLSLLARTSPQADVREIELLELAEAEAAELAAAWLGDGTHTARDETFRIARESRGNPFFLWELTRYARSQAGRHPPGEAPDRPVSLDRVLRDRVERLPGVARTVLELVAVAGQPISSAVVLEAAHAGLRNASALSLLVKEHLVRTGGTPGLDQIETYHDRIRLAVVAGMTADRLRDRHGRLARALETLGGADRATLALHLAEAGESARATRYAADAADRAVEALAFERAARLYRLALELGGVPDGGPLRIKLGDALADAGRGAEAAREYERACENRPIAEALELRRRAAENLLVSGHIDEGLLALRKVLAAAGMRLAATPRSAALGGMARRAWLRLRGLGFRRRDASQVPPETLTRIDICGSVATGLSLVDLLRSSEFQARHLQLALAAGEPSRIARALAIEAGHSAAFGSARHARTADLLQRAEVVARQVVDPRALGFVISVSGIAAFLEGRWRSALERTTQAEVILRERCRGAAWEIDNSNYYGALSLLYQGRIAELAELVPRLVRDAEDRGDWYAATNLRTRLAPFISLAADDPEGAERELDRGVGLWSREGFFLQHWYDFLGRVQVALYQGAEERAFALVVDRWPELERSLLLHVQSVRIHSLHLRARAALAASEELADLRCRPLLRRAARDARRIAREGTAWGDGIARLLLAGVAARRGDPRGALDHLAAARIQFESCEMALHAAVARLREDELDAKGESGPSLRESELRLAGLGVRNPSAMARLLAPGFRAAASVQARGAARPS